MKYDCNKCDYRATMQGSLTRHIQSVHEGVKYDCNKCEYRGTRQSNLTCMDALFVPFTSHLNLNYFIG